MASSLNDGRIPEARLDARHSDCAGLLLFDLDDTIVQGGAYVSKRVLGALRAAHEAGYVLGVASGRPLCLVNKSLLRSGVMDYAICSNGATITRLADNKTLMCRTLSRADALDCMHSLRVFKPVWNGFFNNHAYFEWKGASYMLTGRVGANARALRDTEGHGFAWKALWLARRGMRFAMRTLTNPKQRQVLSVEPYVKRSSAGIEKIGCSIPNARNCDRAFDIVGKNKRFEVVRMGGTELEITARGVSKGTAALWLMERLGLETRDVVSFGDGGNDVPLGNVVGRFVAMGNADAYVKDAADEVCPTVMDDGVAVWIESNLLV